MPGKIGAPGVSGNFYLFLFLSLSNIKFSVTTSIFGVFELNVIFAGERGPQGLQGKQGEMGPQGKYLKISSIDK